MEKIAPLIALLGSLSIMAEPAREYYVALKKSIPMQRLKEKGNTILEINYVQEFTCKGCYQFDVLYKNCTESENINVATFFTRDTNFGHTKILVLRRDSKNGK